MKKLLSILLLFSLFLSACQSNQGENIDPFELSWDEIVEKTNGTTVRMFMWSGDEGINRYMDEWISPKLKEKYNITFERIPMDTQDILQKLLTEKKAGKKEGTIDIVWINGENFKNAKENELLFGPFTEKLPHFNEFVDTRSLNIQYDFGTKTDGYEAPWGKVQFVFLYNEDKVPNPPRSFEELKEWMMDNPGKFTYPEPNDFTGNAFLRHLLYESVGGVQALLDRGFDENFVNKNAQSMWDYLNEIKPHLWREGKTYPSSLTELDRLYSKEEVWMTMGYNEARAESLIKEGTFPENTKSFILDSGSIGNTHFLSIPNNSPNKVGAMVAINFLLSPDAQLAKLKPNYWGENSVLDPDRLTEEMKEKFKQVDRGQSVIPAEILKENMMPEVNSEYVNWLKEKWHEEVVQEK